MHNKIDSELVYYLHVENIQVVISTEQRVAVWARFLFRLQKYLSILTITSIYRRWDNVIQWMEDCMSAIWF